MINTDARIDQYIIKSKEFAQPILIHLRELMHIACPEIKETIKWGMPSFDYKGPLCGMAAFKEHAVFGFWKASLISDPLNYLQERSNNGGEAMGHLGRITKLEDLPPDEAILDFIKQAVKLNEDGIKLPPKPKKSHSEIEVPADLQDALLKNAYAKKTFNNFSPGNKMEYVTWITEAKTAETRSKRLETAIEWMAEGKIRNWKYVRK